MFVGHYGVSFAAKRGEPSIPLWVLFIAVQLLDVFRASSALTRPRPPRRSLHTRHSRW